MAAITPCHLKMIVSRLFPTPTTNLLLYRLPSLVICAQAFIFNRYYIFIKHMVIEKVCYYFQEMNKRIKQLEKGIKGKIRV